MIYEAFMFLNEFDMLDLKLQEHGPYVDKFIITESNRNFNQIEKPYIFMEQYDRYQKYHDKIIYQKFDATDYKNYSLSTLTYVPIPQTGSTLVAAAFDISNPPILYS